MEFIIWALLGLVLCGIGIYAWRAEKPVHFWTLDQKIEVSDIKKYNHAVALLWFSYAAVFLLLGLPLFAGQNSGYIAISVLGGCFSTILMMAVYVRIEKKYRKR